MANDETKTPSLPNPASDPEGFMRAVHETMGVREGVRGNALDRGVTFRDLVDAGLAAPNRSFQGKGRVPASSLISPNGSGTQAVGTGVKPTVITPPKPTGVSTVGTFSNVLITWDDPPYANHDKTEVLRADINDYGAASVIGSSVGGQYADSVGAFSEKYYWVRFVASSGVKGPPSAGQLGKTALDPEYIKASLLATPWEPGKHYSLFQYVIPTVPNGMMYRVSVEGISGATEPTWPVGAGQNVTDGAVTWTAATQDERVPFLIGTVNGQPAVVMDTAYIGDATIGVAKIKDAFLDNLTVIHGTLNYARIEKSNIFELAIDGVLRSGTFSPGGNTGFILRNAPPFDPLLPYARQYVAEFYGDTFFSGDVYGARIMGGIVVAGRFGVPSDADNGSYEYICYSEVVSSQITSSRLDSYGNRPAIILKQGASWESSLFARSECYGAPLGGSTNTQILPFAGLDGSAGPHEFIGFAGFIRPKITDGTDVAQFILNDVPSIKFVKSKIRTNPLDIIALNANDRLNYKRYRHEAVSAQVTMTRDSDLGLPFWAYLSDNFVATMTCMVFTVYAGASNVVVSRKRLTVLNSLISPGNLFSYPGSTSDGLITVTNLGGNNFSGVISGGGMSGTLNFKKIDQTALIAKMICKQGSVINLAFNYMNAVSEGLSLEISLESIVSPGFITDNVPNGMDIGFAFSSTMDNRV
jgi:hypothetical protein